MSADHHERSRAGLLLYVQSGPLPQTADGALGAHAKTVSGLCAFAARWPGSVAITSLERPRLVEEQPPGYEWMRAGEQRDFAVIPWVSRASVGARPPTVIHASVNTPGISELIGIGVPTVLSDDNAPSVRTQITLIGARGPIDRIRIRAGAARSRSKFDRLARTATSFHANGYASFAHYRELNPRALRYFDHRITRADLVKAQPREVSLTRPIHIAYSGRLIEIKGARFLPLLADELSRRSIDFRFSVLGTGPLADVVTTSPHIALKGHLDFDTAWKGFMASVDVMLLPHVQGDSSSTYYEAMGMGVPVLGFENATLTPLLGDGGGGWEVPQGDVRAAADVLERVSRDRVPLMDQSLRAIRYMNRIPMEKVFDDRVDDFRRAAIVGQQ